MMEELSLNILDIAQNSISAGAALIDIEIIEDDAANLLIIRVKDNGKGMDGDFLEKVQNPFVTTHTTRKVGLGISFLKEAAEITGGSFEISSKLNVGTQVTATFIKNHIDRQPMGDIVGTITTLVTLNPEIDFILTYKVNSERFDFTSLEVKEMLGEDITISNPAIVSFLSEYLSQHIEKITKRSEVNEVFGTTSRD